ncbi:A-kinase anchor protein 14 [Thunnus maccoyii]|uniref:A-kinase anchor protein 14 n=1 Tax=Thunnus maccoyii TaxID=8240 RepID=UPI001C4D0CFE|nr:A-kinase anchor protein 14 [Thunnus maccoyii]
MEEQRPSANLNLTTESAQLVKTLLDRHRHADDHVNNMNWVTSKDFTVDVGKKQIAEYIQSWELQSCWLYSLDPLYTTEEEHHTLYHYRARFSTPTPRAPIQGTASVYFVVDISKVRPRSLPVEVHFIVESNRLVHTAGKSKFREKWLADVIESKTLLRRAVDL